MYMLSMNIGWNMEGIVYRLYFEYREYHECVGRIGTSATVMSANTPSRQVIFHGILFTLFFANNIELNFYCM